MCGFGGVINNRFELSQHQVAEIAGHVNFRGPDNCGIRILNHRFENTASGTNSLFFNRLAILDLDSRSNQPFENDQFLLLFNGEIYNYTELKNKLQNEGVKFRTTSDTEVLFHCLHKWGRQALPLLNGMFSFFWLDKTNHTYLAARDRLGIKPLYYYFYRGTFYFASELHTILRLLPEQPEISTDAIHQYLWMQYVPTPNTIFKGIKKLPPGSCISGKTNGDAVTPEPESYWDAYQYAASRSDESKPEQLELVLRDSIERQLQADVPIGLFLSSGVDSSLLAAIVNKYFTKSQNVNFFTVSFGNSVSQDESQDAINYIKGFNNPHLINHILELTPDYLQTHLTRLYRYFDEPFGDYASLLNWGISEKAREHVTVALSGDGADELFWGYNRYNKWQQLEQFNRVPEFARLLKQAGKLLPASSLGQKLKNSYSPDPVQRHFDLFLLPAFRDKLKSTTSFANTWAMENSDLVSQRKDLPGILDLKTYLADAMLYKVDRASMATSLEVRVPYLDNKVVDYALHLDLKFKSNKTYQNKAILRKLIKELAPHYDVHRPKKGFSFPLRSWLENEWKELVLDSVDKKSLSSLGLDPKPYHQIIVDFYGKKNKAEVEVWYLLNLALWKNSMDELSNTAK